MSPIARPLRTRVLDVFRSAWKVPQLERALARITNGREYRGVIARLPPNPYGYAEGSLRRVRRYELELEVDLGDLVGWYVYFGFRDDSHEQLLTICQPGNVVVDVGANIGLTALRAARQVGTRGKILAIEPDPANFRSLSRNCELNPELPIHVHNVAVGSSAGDVELTTPVRSNRGMIHVSQTGSGGVRVPLRTIDELVGDAHVDVIKVDTEGFELEVLRGASTVLRRSRPRLFLELDERNLRRQGSSGEALLRMLLDAGYEVRGAGDGRRIEPENAASAGHIDIVALPT